MTAPSVRRLGHLAAVTAAGLAAAGCGSSVTRLSLPVPPPTSASPPTTVVVPSDFTGVRQGPVPGGTTTTVPAIGPGQATIDGSVLGPAGPVAGATVQAERIVGSAVVSTQATTGADGSFTIAGVLGGVYRVRAWQAPALDLVVPELFFLGTTDTHALTLQLTSYAGVQVATSMAPLAVDVGAAANVVVAATQQTVGVDGVVRPEPMAGASVSLDGGASWVPATADPTVTDSQGRATFEVTCVAPGAGGLVATVAGASPSALGAAECLTPPPPTTVAPDQTTTTTLTPPIT